MTTTAMAFAVAGLLLLLSLSLQVALVTASPFRHFGPTRIAFYPRGGSDVGVRSRRSSHSSTLSPSMLLARRRSPPQAPPRVWTAGLRRKRAPAQTLDLDEDFDPAPQDDREPTLEELRGQLGPVGKFTANAVELAVTTAGSYISGGILGYVGGSVLGIPSTLFGKDMGGLGARWGALHAKAWAAAGNWATLSAAFSGSHNLARVCRGGFEDQWNAVIGSALAGAFLNRAGGAAAMFRGGTTYAGFTYLLDQLFGSSSSREGSGELMYTDVPLDD